MTTGKVSLEETILKRRSQRNFTKKDLRNALCDAGWGQDAISQAAVGYSKD